MRSLPALALGIVLLVSSTVAEAQRFTKRKQYWSVGGSVNAMNYLGDITPARNPASVDFLFTRPNIGAEAMKRMTPRVSVRGQLFWGRIKGDDLDNPRPGHDNRNQGFKNDVQELSVQGIFDFFENRGTFLKRPDYTPYAMLGIGAFYHNPRMRVGNDKPSSSSYVAYNSIAMEKTSRLQPTLMYGLGFRYKLARQWDIALEIGWRLTMTDKLDGLHGYYVNPADYTGDYSMHNKRLNGARDYYVDADNTGELRANKRNDAYTVTGFHLTYILAGGVKCPKFR